MNNYARMLADPFDMTISQPKLYDGSIDRSSGIRLRTTGKITCRFDGEYTYVVLFPGFSSTICWFADLSDTTTDHVHKVPGPFTNHVESY